MSNDHIISGKFLIDLTFDVADLVLAFGTIAMLLAVPYGYE